MDCSKISFIFILCLACVKFCNAQEDVPLKKPDIYSLHIFSDIKYRFATTKITSRVRNVYKTSSETIFDVTLPNEAFITNLTLEIDGKIVLGEIKEKEVAKKQYEDAKMRGESAGYIGTQNRETNKFNLAVTVAPLSKVSFNLTYQELLRRKNSHYEQVIYIDPGQPVEDMDVTVAILESREITQLRVPPLRNDIGDSLADLSTLTVITQPTPKTANVKFIPSVDQQIAQAASGMAGQFVVQYDVERGMDAGDVLVVNGYFVHFFAPEGLEPIPHNVLFILDVSGSMDGRKMSQLKQAMRSIIKQLIKGDRMNIMKFARTTGFWKNEMMDVTDEDVIDEAFRYVDSLQATGSTNIEQAIRDGLQFLNDDNLVNSTVRSPVIVFLTDGEATSGITNRNAILRSVRKWNENNIPIFSLGFGEYADYDLIKKISLQNNGFGRKIYEASDAAMQIVGFYNEIAVTLLNNITFKYLDKPVQNVTKHVYANYFNGSEMVICGFIDPASDAPELGLRISASTVHNANLVLTGGFENIIRIDDDNLTKSGDFEEITEKVWAYLTIKQLLDKKLAADDTATIESYKKKVLELSLRYGFVTPLTSMVVTMPKDLEDVKVSPPGLSDKVESKIGESGRVGSTLVSRGRAVKHSPPGLRANMFGSRSLGPSMMYNAGMHGVSYDAMSALPPPQHLPVAASIQPNRHRKKAKADAGMHRVPNRAMSPPKHYPVAADIQPKRRRKKNNQKVSGFEFPVLVNVPQSICLKMLAQSQPSGVVLLHESQKGIRIELRLKQSTSKRRKKNKQVKVEEVRLISNTTKAIITVATMANKNIPVDHGLWDVSYNGSRLDILTSDFKLIILKSDLDILNLIVDEIKAKSTFSGVGVLDQLMATSVSFFKSRTSQKGKEHALFKLKGKKTLAIARQLNAFYPNSFPKCWDLRKKEAKFIDMNAAMLQDFTS